MHFFVNDRSEKKNRIQWLDYGKGIAIILVVMGHAIQEFRLNCGLIDKIIYSFHMSAFFIFSGYLFKDVNKIEFRAFFKKKAKQLMLPYLVFCGLIFICHAAKRLILNSDQEFFNNFLTPKTLINTILVTNKSIFSNMWFLPCILAAECLIWFVFKRFSNERLRGFVCLMFGIAAFVYGRLFDVSLPFCLEAACLAVFFMYIGHIIKILKSEQYINKLTVIFVLFLIFLGVNLYSYYIGKYSLDSFYNIRFDNIVLFIVTSVIGTLLLIGCCQKFKNIRALSFLGKNSLYIYGLHYISQNLLGFLGIPHTTGLFYSVLLLVFYTVGNIVISAIILLIFKVFQTHLKLFLNKKKGLP